MNTNRKMKQQERFSKPSPFPPLPTPFFSVPRVPSPSPSLLHPFPHAKGNPLFPPPAACEKQLLQGAGEGQLHQHISHLTILGLEHAQHGLQGQQGEASYKHCRLQQGRPGITVSRVLQSWLSAPNTAVQPLHDA